MSWDPEQLPALLAAVADAVESAGDAPPVVLIDGPSGAGKSSLADLLVRRWPAAAICRLCIA